MDVIVLGLGPAQQCLRQLLEGSYIAVLSHGLNHPRSWLSTQLVEGSYTPFFPFLYASNTLSPNAQAVSYKSPKGPLDSCNKQTNKHNWTPIFFIGSPPILPPTTSPPTPCTVFFFFFYPNFFYRGPPLYPPPQRRPPLPLAQSKKK